MKEKEIHFIRGYVAAVANFLCVEGKVTPAIREAFTSACGNKARQSLDKICDRLDMEIIEQHWDALNS